MKKSAPQKPGSPSELIDGRIRELGDWRGETLSRLRTLIKQADPEVVEEWKWRGTPVWSHDGIICTGETYKSVVKMTFAKGASLKDPSGLFNSGLEGNARRAIDFHEGDKIDEKALKASRSLRRCPEYIKQRLGVYVPTRHDAREDSRSSYFALVTSSCRNLRIVSSGIAP